MNTTTQKMGISGRIAALFLQAQITPLLALLAFLLGVFAVLVTPREEEPQINVTMANVLIPFPGASVADVEQMVATPAEQLLSGMEGTEHVMSVSRPGLAVLTVQFKVGVPRTEALVRLHDQLRSHADFVPEGLGVLQPLIRPKGIDDVPIVSFTLHGKDADASAFDLERVAHSVEAELQRVPGTREVRSIGGPGRAVLVRLQPERMAGTGMTVPELRAALQSANLGLPVGDLLAGEKTIALEAGPFLSSADEVADLVVGTRGGRPVFLKDVAEVRDGPPPAQRMVWLGKPGKQGPEEFPAVTLQITKKPGENAIDVANALAARMAQLRNTVIPDDVQVVETRNYGETANDKAQKLIQKLLFATASVVALVFIALGRREAAIVGLAVVLTLTATLFASWAWGFTLNRVSLFALIFSIGILVDDAIVVVENIHRHQQLEPGVSLLQSIPRAVDEVGGPTILATFTVIAALLPMAFVSGLMGPYMAPIPINASMGMLISLAIAFVVTPWLARRWMKPHTGEGAADGHAGLAAKLEPRLQRIFGPLLDARRGARNRALLGLAAASLLARGLPGSGAFRTLYVLPWVCSPLAVAVLWRWILAPTDGALSTLLGRRIEWLTDPGLALPVVSAVTVWTNVGYVTLFFLAGILAIPPQIQAAARLDGASGWQRFACSSNFGCTQGRAMHIMPPLFIGCTLTNHCTAANQGRFVAVCFGCVNRLQYGVDIMTIHCANHLPTIGFKASWRIIGEPAFDITINRNAVVVIEGNQLTQAPSPSQ